MFVLPGLLFLPAIYNGCSLAAKIKMAAVRGVCESPAVPETVTPEHRDKGKGVVAWAHRRTPEECRTKTKTLQQMYKKVIGHNLKLGNC